MGPATERRQLDLPAVRSLLTSVPPSARSPPARPPCQTAPGRAQHALLACTAQPAQGRALRQLELLARGRGPGADEHRVRAHRLQLVPRHARARHRRARDVRNRADTARMSPVVDCTYALAVIVHVLCP